ncbi:P-loop containing nucleoside triphosphate hydrolase protein [Geranomyces variabilis]|nr:P-loop containing nucleoside triphosphate hydrolase protein [Geranomyces variabilis]
MLTIRRLAVLLQRSGLPQICCSRLPPAAIARRTLPRRHLTTATPDTSEPEIPPKPTRTPPVAPPAPDASFADLGVAETLCQNLLADGSITEPSDFQRSVIPRLIRGQTMIITAETGSGKTFAYLLPLLTRYLGPNGRHAREEEKMNPLSPRILILVPNRELCVQNLRVLHSLTAGMGITATTFPPPPSVLLSALTNPDIVVTTAAALDRACKSPKLINQFLARTQACVADEADWIASDTVGLRILQHVSRVSKKRNQSAAIQFVFAAATLPPVLHKKSTTPREMIQRLFASIHKVSSKHTHSPPRGLVEEFLPVVESSSRPLTLEEEDRVKCDALLALMLENAQKMAKDPEHADKKWIVFCNDSRRAKVVHAAVDAFAASQSSPESGISITCELLYGAKLTANERSEKVLEFVSAGTGPQPPDERKFRVLVSTDLVARGVDFRDVTTVVQVDFPLDASAYLHRVGRTARVGKQGRGKTCTLHKTALV